MPSFLNPTFLLAMLLALSVHEAAHAYVAYKLGDHTAKAAGRLTLNPIAHLDPMGTILFLLVGFGWGKPVPVNPHFFKNPERDNALTALAGPVSNLLLATIAFLALKFILQMTPGSVLALLQSHTHPNIFLAFLCDFLLKFIFVNLGLMAFNLLPVAPLDGSKILSYFIPLRFQDAYDQYMEYGPYVLLTLLLVGNFMHFDPLGAWIMTIMGMTLDLFHFLFGY